MRSMRQVTPLKSAPIIRSATTTPGDTSALSVAPTKQESTRYSPEKFLALQHYVDSTPTWRVALVIFVTPIPGLVGALIPSFVPLQNPLAGVRANPGYMADVFLLCSIVHFGTLLHWRAGAELPSHVYPTSNLVLVALVTAITHTSCSWLFAFAWRFPTPMSWIVVSSVTGSCLGIGHLVVFRQRCWRDREFIDGIKRYVPALLYQCGQILVYPAFSVLFDNVSPVFQVLLTLTFPFLKYAMKRGLRKYTRDLKDFSSEVAVTGIEICASLYQSMILQNSPSKVALAIIMGADVLHGLITVKIFMDRPSSLPRHDIVRAAVDELRRHEGVRAHNKQPIPLSSTPADFEKRPALPSTIEEDAEPESKVQTLPPHSPTDTVDTGRQHSPVVTQALNLVNVAESILLVEYLEVAIPLINVLFVVISCQFNAAQYNTRLRRLYFHPEVLRDACESIILYSLLQAASFLAMHLVMRYRYGLSAAHQLAFILEHHWQSIVGKMIGWLPIILHFTVIHYGVDFSFQFDFASMLTHRDTP